MRRERPMDSMESRAKAGTPYPTQNDGPLFSVSQLPRVSVNDLNSDLINAFAPA
jgi:hypothetical protein